MYVYKLLYNIIFLKEKESKLNLGFLASSDLRYILITTSVKTVIKNIE